MSRSRTLAAAVAVMVAAAGAGVWQLTGSDQPAPPVSSPTFTPTTGPTSLAPTPSAPGPARALTIGVIGDYGKRGGQATAMVRVLRDYAAAHALDGRLAALVTTGDNAYERGTTAEVTFARGLLDPLLRGSTRLVASLGNHDVSTRDGAPAKKGFGIPADYYTTTVGPVQFVVLDANTPTDAQQRRWLRDTLAAPRTVAYRVAVFHQPAAACSAHAADPDIVRLWLPLLDRGVDLVLSGHNHTYERFVDRAGLPLVTTGGGGAQLYPSVRALCTGPATPKVLRSTYNVVVLRLSEGRMQLLALDRGGAVIDRHPIVARPGPSS